MLYIHAQDFFEKVSAYKRLSRQEEIAAATAMKQGDAQARQRLMESYLPMVAGHIRRSKPRYRTLTLVYTCLQALEKEVDSFNFLQDREPFAHRLSWRLRRTILEYILTSRAAAN
jgi:DNA-directed RNA polymerase sigma subunit (sigma70/sigma32)